MVPGKMVCTSADTAADTAADATALIETHQAAAGHSYVHGMAMAEGHTGLSMSALLVQYTSMLAAALALT